MFVQILLETVIDHFEEGLKSNYSMRPILLISLKTVGMHRFQIQDSSFVRSFSFTGQSKFSSLFQRDHNNFGLFLKF